MTTWKMHRRNKLAHHLGLCQRHSLAALSSCRWINNWNWFACTFPAHSTVSTIGRHIFLCKKWRGWENEFDYVQNAPCQWAPSVWLHRMSSHKLFPVVCVLLSMLSMGWCCCCHCSSMMRHFVLDRKMHWSNNWCLVSSTIVFHSPVWLLGWDNGMTIRQHDCLFQPHCNLVWIGLDIFPSPHCSARRKKEENDLFINVMGNLWSSNR